MSDYEKSPSTIGARRRGDLNFYETMADEGDGNDSRYSQELPGNELEDDATLNAADITLTTADQSTTWLVSSVSLQLMKKSYNDSGPLYSSSHPMWQGRELTFLL